MVKKCSVEDCEKKAHCRTWCHMHYRRWYLYGDVNQVRVIIKLCGVDGCGKPHKALGLCGMHALRLAKNGNLDARPLPSGPASATWKGNEISYSGAHRRVEAAKGGAADHFCHCGEPGHGWAYDHLDPEELYEVRYGSRSPYSTDPDHYTAMCASCHKNFDNDFANSQNEVSL